MYEREGLALTDLVTFGEAVLRLSPPRGDRLETATEFSSHVAGPESNVAVAASMLELDTAWLSKLPDSPLGHRIARALRANGVRTGIVWTDDGRVGVNYHEYGGGPRGVDTVTDREGSVATTTTARELPLSAVREAGAFFVSGVTPALSETVAETAATLLETAAEADGMTVFDPHYRPRLWPPDEALSGYEPLLEHVDTLVLTEDEMEDVFGFDGPVINAAHSLRTRYSLDTVVVRRPHHEPVGLHGGEIYEGTNYETEDFDTAGVRDAFVGGFVTERIRGEGMQRALNYGAATEALKRTIGGDVAVVSRSDVDRVLIGESSAVE